MFSDYLLEAGGLDDVVLVDGTQRYTYGDLGRAAGRLVAALETAGIRPGSAIGLLGTNSFFWLAGYLAALKFGLVVPLSDKQADQELAAQVEWAGCVAVLADRRQLRRVGDVLGHLPVVTDQTLADDGPTSWPHREVPLDTDAALMFTSGTTARPKAVRLTHRNLMANTRSIVEYLGLGRSDRVLVILPFHYVFGASLLHTHLAVGGSMVLCHTFTYPETAVDLIAEHQCTGLAGVPSSYQLLIKASTYRKRPLPSLRVVQQAGGALAPELILDLARAQPTSRVFVMYGQTEATARLSYLPPELLEAKSGSIGRGIPGVTLSVEDADGRPVGVGGPGEIVATGDNISPGYHRDPDATRVKFRDGRLRTGDLATVDEDGYIFIVGRSGDFIKTWGYRVSPQQVEEAALGSEHLTGAVAVGMPDDEAGEAIHLVVSPVPDAGVDAGQVMEFLRQRLPKHMLPKSVHVVGEIPLTANGKVSRTLIRNLLSEGP